LFEFLVAAYNEDVLFVSMHITTVGNLLWFSTASDRLQDGLPRSVNTGFPGSFNS